MQAERKRSEPSDINVKINPSTKCFEHNCWIPGFSLLFMYVLVHASPHRLDVKPQKKKFHFLFLPPSNLIRTECYRFLCRTERRHFRKRSLSSLSICLLCDSALMRLRMFPYGRSENRKRSWSNGRYVGKNLDQKRRKKSNQRENCISLFSS